MTLQLDYIPECIWRMLIEGWLYNVEAEEVEHNHVHHFFCWAGTAIDNNFLCKNLAGVARSLETEGNI